MNSPESVLRIAILGGGISGLAAAHRLCELAQGGPRRLELTLFEAGRRCGGVTGTQALPGYLVEQGADSFITNKPGAINLCRRLGLEDRLISTSKEYRGAFVVRRGRLLRVPEGFQLLAPAQIWPVLTSPIFSWRGKLRMGLELFLPNGSRTEDESLASFVTRRFGREALDRLVQPLVGGIYTSDPAKLSLRATLPRFLEMERQHGSLIRASWRTPKGAAGSEKATGARYGLFATLVGGIRELTDALQERIAASTVIQRNTTITSLQPLPEGGYQLEWAGGLQNVDAVVIALPAPRAGDLLAPLSQPLAGLLRQIEYASSVVVVSGHKLADIAHPLDAFGVVVPAVERRSILAVSFPSRKFPDRAPPGCVQLRTFVGGAMQPELCEKSDAELFTLVRGELADLLGVRHPPEFELLARHTRAMPQYHVGHLDLVARIDTAAATLPALVLCGNAYRGVGLPDCIQDAEHAAERLWEQVQTGS